nr:immunoglobulin light chain junction region [Macaca mulatta]
CQQGNSKPFTF